MQVRCIITGPQDTPYEGGMFVFDVFFPEGYPNVPPLMVLETTGEGRARFNPNLYAGMASLSTLYVDDVHICMCVRGGRGDGRRVQCSTANSARHMSQCGR